ncbi:MAG TPA: PqiC family protein [Candidatus Binatia bacterium]|nr:PqiC family protein [Candidatus Binatia bacterium]
MFFRKGLCVALFFLCVVPTGCLSLGPQPDPSRFYVLATLPRTEATAKNTDGLALGIGPVRLPGYLDRQQLVTRVSQNRFAVAESDRWAEPLEENFSRVLAQNLAILLNTDGIVAYPWERNRQPTYQVQVEVLRFEPNAEQRVELWARWRLSDGAKKTSSMKESYLTRPMKNSSTEAAVAALSEVVGDLSKEIAATIGVSISGQERRG